MKWMGLLTALALSLWSVQVLAQSERAEPPEPTEHADTEAGTETFLKKNPLIERYMLDELKSLRTEIYDIRTQTTKDITDRELTVADKAMSYANSTVTFFFYGFLAVTGIMTLVGWNSLREIKAAVRNVAEREVRGLREDYEGRLTALEQELQAKGRHLLESQEEIQKQHEERLTAIEVELNSKGEAILETQRQIEKTQTIHALWLQANQASNPRTKIEFYDRILELDPGDMETMAYKADAALQLGDRDWALNLCNHIIEQSPENALAYYHRACTRVGLGEIEAAIADLTRALELAPSLREQARWDEEFKPLYGQPDFARLVPPEAPPSGKSSGV